MPALPRSTMTHLECSRCGKTHAHNRLQNLCTCGKPLLARYELKAAAKTLTREALTTRPANMRRYAEVLPGGPPESLGEGMTPLLDARKVGAALGLKNLYVKDEGLNPTGSFKARGLSAAVTRAKALGASSLAIPTAGNARGTRAGDAAPAGLASGVVQPAGTPRANGVGGGALGRHLAKNARLNS